MPVAIFVVCALIYTLMLGARANGPTSDNHFVHLAYSWLHGQLDVVGGNPPGTNDWACYDTLTHGACPAGVFHFADAQRYRWYVSFPPLPALVILPLVALFGLATRDALFWAILAGLGPSLLYVLFRFLRETGRSDRSPRDDLLLTALFAFGTPFFFTAVQGTVWFAAHVVAVPLLVLYVLFAIDARRPVWAGVALGLAFMTRPTTALLAIFFGLAALQASRPDDVEAADPDALVWKRIALWLRGVRWGSALRRIALFAAPILVVGAIAMWLNVARFHSPFAFGHRYLQIRWRGRIERWGLFNYHYLSKNLAVFLASLPWLSAEPPYIQVSGHGLALWVTTPGLLWVLWPKRTTHRMAFLWLAIGPVMLLDLMYQNSGWLQFAYRFALDYLPLLFVLLALGRRRFGPGFWALALLAIALNTFGAATFNRAPRFYVGYGSQNVLFQPD